MTSLFRITQTDANTYSYASTNSLENTLVTNSLVTNSLVVNNGIPDTQLQEKYFKVTDSIPFTVISVDTVDSSTPATVELRAVSNPDNTKTYEFSFQIPQGERGIDGIIGVDGISGESAIIDSIETKNCNCKYNQFTK